MSGCSPMFVRSQRVADFCAPMMMNVGSARPPLESAIEPSLPLAENVVAGYPHAESPTLRAYTSPMEAADSPDAPDANAAGSRDVADPERMQRRLRALSAVNRQLHAQLEGGTVRLAGTS